MCARRVEKGLGVVDIINPTSIDALVNDTVETYGKLDILVNNATNVALKDGQMDELTHRNVRRYFSERPAWHLLYYKVCAVSCAQ